MYFNAANCYEALPTVTWVTTLAAGTYTWYPQHATGVGASESSASAYVSMTEYTMSVGAPVQVNADWNATSGLAQILNKPTKLTQFTNDLTGSSAGWTVPGVVTVNNNAPATLTTPDTSNTTVVAGTKLTWGNCYAGGLYSSGISGNAEGPNTLWHSPKWLRASVLLWSKYTCDNV